MNIALIGLNHKTSPLELRESLSFTAQKTEDFLKKLKDIYPSQEFLILSTCNRVEMYIGNIAYEREIDGFISLLASYHNKSKEELLPFIYVYTEEKAIAHLFEVASGVDSLVIGEAQILGQIKNSYKKALELDTAGKVLNAALQKAFRVAKKVRTLTKIGEGNVSISSIACELAEEVLEGLSGKKVLLIGAGKVGTLTLKSLHKRGADALLVSNRNYEKAKSLANEFHGRAIRFDKIEDFIIEADIVISSTSAPHYVLHPDMLKRIMTIRKNKPMFLIDLAVPRDIDPNISQIKEIHLFNIDSLKTIAEQNMKKREGELSYCREIIAKETQHFAFFLAEEPFLRDFVIRPSQNLLFVKSNIKMQNDNAKCKI